ncbi:MAG: PAS domain-containing protein [Kiloniellaceae bacterium]
MTVELRPTAVGRPAVPASRRDWLWVGAGVAVSLAAFLVDVTTPRGVAAGVFPHFVAIGLSAPTAARLAPYALAGLATVLTLAGLAFVDGGAPAILLVNRAFLVASYWLVAFLVHQKQVADWKLLQGYAGLEDSVRQRTSELADSESRLRLITDRLPALIAYVDAEERYAFVNAYYEEAIGAATDKVFGRHIREVMGEAAYAVVAPNVRRVLAGEVVRCAIHLPTPKGERNFRVTYLPDRDASGAVAGFVLLALDVSEEEDLQRKLEQAQKLEAVGQLSGGIAHDFNNLLGVIIGNLELASARAGDDLKRYLDAAMLSAERGASLTRRLLAFARRQPLQPSVIDANAVIRSMEEMLDRSLGARIEVAFARAAGLWPTLADAHQLEAAILNLALNARDAMPEGGRLGITTGHQQLDAEGAAALGLPAGDYVSITLSDSGIGMNADTRARAFEPFFTTKAFGRGSGLGLPMVYGFAKQSGGTVTLDSVPGEGSSVRIYLPRAAAAATAEAPAAPADSAPPLGQGSAVLLVEDDAALRAVVVAMLERLDYRVVPCADAARALERLAGEDFEFLLTDIELPGDMNGWRLAEAALARAPALAVVHMSGTTEHARAERHPAGHAKELLVKPFRQDQLARALVRARQAAGAAGAGEA